MRMQGLCHGHTLLLLIMPHVLIACVHIPQMPLHGSLKIKSSKFGIQLKCSANDEDIALGAPGDEGKLVCDQNDDQTQKLLRRVDVPPCLPRRNASKIILSVMLTFFVKDHNALAGDIYRDTVRGYFKNKCPKCTYRKQKPARFGGSLDRVIMKISFQIEAAHDYSKALWFHKVREGSSSALSEALKKISDENLNLSSIVVDHWKGLCDDSIATGSKLGQDGVVSCRGCPANQFKEPNQDRCVFCPFGQFTAQPFSSKSQCQNCPEGELTAQQRLACFARDD